MDILIKGERIELPKIGEFYIDIRIYETGEIVIDGDQDKTAKAIELPPHGDLKDETDIIHRIEKIADADLAQDIIGEILASPTIVEANNGTDN